MRVHPDIERQLPDAIRRFRFAAEAGVPVTAEVAAVLIAALEPPELRRARRDAWLRAAHQALRLRASAASQKIAQQLRVFGASPSECHRVVVSGTDFARAVANAFLVEPEILTARHITRILRTGGTFQPGNVLTPPSTGSPAPGGMAEDHRA